MKRIISFVFAVGVAWTLMAVEAEAGGRCGTCPASVNRRQNRQQNRIGQGVRSGELTRRETYGLSREQYQIRREERRYRADGEFTRRERAELQRELNQASRHIHRAKHNERDRN